MNKAVMHRPIVLVNTTRVTSTFLESLELTKDVDLKASDALQADLVIQSFPSPLAVCLGSCVKTRSKHFAGTDTMANGFHAPQCFERMKHVQENYRNSAALVICENDEQWNSLNVEFPTGVMRLHWVHNIDEMTKALDGLYMEMSLAAAGGNLKSQANFFQESQNRLCHSRNSERVYVETLGKLNIPPHEREEIMKKLPGIERMVTADYKKVRHFNAEKAHLDSLGFFFCPPI